MTGKSGIISILKSALAVVERARYGAAHKADYADSDPVPEAYALGYAKSAMLQAIKTLEISSAPRSAQ